MVWDRLKEGAVDQLLDGCRCVFTVRNINIFDTVSGAVLAPDVKPEFGPNFRRRRSHDVLLSF